MLAFAKTCRYRAASLRFWCPAAVTMTISAGLAAVIDSIQTAKSGLNGSIVGTMTVASSEVRTGLSGTGVGLQMMKPTILAIKRV